MSHPLSRPGFAHASARDHAHERVAALVARYPDLSPAQMSELAGQFPRLGALDVALMMADDRLGPKLEAFCSANRDLLSPAWQDYAVIGAILSLPVVILLTLMAAG